MIIIETSKINHVEYIRMYSDQNCYLKLPNSDELLTEVMTLGGEPLDVIETDIQIRSPEPELPEPYGDAFRALDILLGVEDGQD